MMTYAAACIFQDIFFQSRERLCCIILPWPIICLRGAGILRSGLPCSKISSDLWLLSSTSCVKAPEARRPGFALFRVNYLVETPPASSSFLLSFSDRSTGRPLARLHSGPSSPFAQLIGWERHHHHQPRQRVLFHRRHAGRCIIGERTLWESSALLLSTTSCFCRGNSSAIFRAVFVNEAVAASSRKQTACFSTQLAAGLKYCALDPPIPSPLNVPNYFWCHIAAAALCLAYSSISLLILSSCVAWVWLGLISSVWETKERWAMFCLVLPLWLRASGDDWAISDLWQQAAGQGEANQWQRQRQREVAKAETFSTTCNDLACSTTPKTKYIECTVHKQYVSLPHDTHLHVPVVPHCATLYHIVPHYATQTSSSFSQMPQSTLWKGAVLCVCLSSVGGRGDVEISEEE